MVAQKNNWVKISKDKPRISGVCCLKKFLQHKTEGQIFV